MKSRLRKVGLLDKADKGSEINIKVAWSTLSRLGYPARFSGKAQDGSFEYVIIDPHTGRFMASGKGSTLEMAMCKAALNAVSHINSS